MREPISNSEIHRHRKLVHCLALACPFAWTSEGVHGHLPTAPHGFRAGLQALPMPTRSRGMGPDRPATERLDAAVRRRRAARPIPAEENGLFPGRSLPWERHRRHRRESLSASTAEITFVIWSH